MCMCKCLCVHIESHLPVLTNLEHAKKQILYSKAMLKLFPRFQCNEDIMASLRLEEVDSIMIKHTLKVRISMTKVGKDLIG